MDDKGNELITASQQNRTGNRRLGFNRSLLANPGSTPIDRAVTMVAASWEAEYIKIENPNPLLLQDNPRLKSRNEQKIVVEKAMGLAEQALIVFVSNHPEFHLVGGMAFPMNAILDAKLTPEDFIDKDGDALNFLIKFLKEAGENFARVNEKEFSVVPKAEVLKDYKETYEAMVGTWKTDRNKDLKGRINWTKIIPSDEAERKIVLKEGREWTPTGFEIEKGYNGKAAIFEGKKVSIEPSDLIRGWMAHGRQRDSIIINAFQPESYYVQSLSYVEDTVGKSYQSLPQENVEVVNWWQGEDHFALGSWKLSIGEETYLVTKRVETYTENLNQDLLYKYLEHSPDSIEIRKIVPGGKLEPVLKIEYPRHSGKTNGKISLPEAGIEISPSLFSYKVLLNLEQSKEVLKAVKSIADLICTRSKQIKSPTDK